MIRDEFINKQKTENLTPKELDGIRKLGERAFFTSEITNKLKFIKSANMSTWFSFILGVTMLIFLILVAVFDFKKLFIWYSIVGLVFMLLLFGWTLLWFTYIRVKMLKKIDSYKERVKQLTQKEMLKQKSAYNFYNKKREE